MKNLLRGAIWFLCPCLLLSTDKQAESILLHQRDNGGWPKNYDRDRSITEGERKVILANKNRNDATFDNGATHTEIRYLAKTLLKTKDPRYLEAVLKGIRFMLAAQYPNGGWPQRFPKPSGYSAHITFNDGAMIGVMSTLRDISRDKIAYPFVSDELRERCRKAAERGIPCILKCQIVVNGKKTAWCAQHDEKTLIPRKARSYELPSISGAESVGVVRFLMVAGLPHKCVVGMKPAARFGSAPLRKRLGVLDQTEQFSGFCRRHRKRLFVEGLSKSDDRSNFIGFRSTPWRRRFRVLASNPAINREL